nr:hypothetical protein [Tanacetum cinerariifolium]
MRILSVVSLKTLSRYGYTFLREIVLQRADYKEHKISEADFKNLHHNDFEDFQNQRDLPRDNPLEVLRTSKRYLSITVKMEILLEPISNKLLVGKDNGKNILKSIDEGPFRMGKFKETLVEGTKGALHLGPERDRVFADLSPKENDRDSKVKRALFTTPIATKSNNLGDAFVVAKSRLSVAKTPTATNKVSFVLSLSPDSSQKCEVTGFDLSAWTLVFDTFLALTAMFLGNGVTQRSVHKVPD